MATASDDIEKLYEHGEKLASSKDKTQNEKDYLGVIAAATGSSKAKLFAAQQIPRFFKFFPQLSAEGINAQLDLCEDDDINIRLPAIRGLPFLCKDTPEHLPKIADVLGQLLIGEEPEHGVVQNSLMQVLRQDPKGSLAAIFKHIESSEDKLRENVLSFIRDKVFPNKASVLVPQAEMERHVTDLIKGIQDVTGEEFSMFMAFLQGLALFGAKAPPERMQELVEIVEGQADLLASFDASDTDHIERVMACLQMALPFFARGGSNSKFFNFIAKHILPAFDKVAEDRRGELLRSMAEASPFTSPADSRHLLPGVTDLLKEYMAKKGADVDITSLEALLFTFNQLAHKTPNATNALCGYKIVTGQPSDRLGEDFKDLHADWLARVTGMEDEVKKRIKAVLQEVAEVGKQQRSAKDEPTVTQLKEKKAAAARTLKALQNIEKLSKPLKSTVPQFLGGKAAPALSWKPEAAPAGPSAPKPGSTQAVGYVSLLSCFVSLAFQISRCRGNGRPDSGFVRYSWYSNSCGRTLRFNSKSFLNMIKGKTIAVIGDSLTAANFVPSLLCQVRRDGRGLVAAVRLRGTRCCEVRVSRCFARCDRKSFSGTNILFPAPLPSSPLLRPHPPPSARATGAQISEVTTVKNGSRRTLDGGSGARYMPPMVAFYYDIPAFGARIVSIWDDYLMRTSVDKGMIAKLATGFTPGPDDAIIDVETVNPQWGNIVGEWHAVVMETTSHWRVVPDAPRLIFTNDDWQTLNGVDPYMAHARALKTIANFFEARRQAGKAFPVPFFMTAPPQHSAKKIGGSGVCGSPGRVLNEKEIEKMLRTNVQLSRYWPMQRAAFPEGSAVRRFDITLVSAYRPEAHCGIYSKKNNPVKYLDCLHWCQPGVPDIWVDLFHEMLLAEPLFSGDSTTAASKPKPKPKPQTKPKKPKPSPSPSKPKASPSPSKPKPSPSPSPAKSPPPPPPPASPPPYVPLDPTKPNRFKRKPGT
ncbi:unnamed protein product [Closterium sp. Yama58-4]|nr:unnamed protein product [Closterium sp. Yama58-4]